MSPEERQLLQGVFDRMRTNAGASRDNEADQLIADNVRQQPYSPYYLTQAVIVQEQALQAANQRIKQLEQHIEKQPSAPQSGGFLSGLFGSGGAQREVPSAVPARGPAPVWNQGTTGAQGGGYPGGGFQGGNASQGGGYQPGYQSAPQQGGPWAGGAQQAGGFGGSAGGGGFLRGALTTAAGVAGGALLFDGIKGLMGGHGSPLGIGAGVPGVGDTTVNNYYGDGGSAQTASDYQQDMAQDAGDYGSGSGGGTAADWQQDADQDQDDAQDAGDYGGDDGSYDV